MPVDAAVYARHSPVRDVVHHLHGVRRSLGSTEGDPHATSSLATLPLPFMTFVAGQCDFKVTSSASAHRAFEAMAHDSFYSGAVT
jgi:hypothetical protein